MRTGNFPTLTLPSGPLAAPPLLSPQRVPPTTTGNIASPENTGSHKISRALQGVKTFAHSLNPKAAIWDTKGERVIGPAPQYVLSAINANRSPFNIKTVGTLALYAGLIYFATKTGITNGPIDVVSFFDDVGDTVVRFIDTTLRGVSEFKSLYLDGFTLPSCTPGIQDQIPGETCYVPGGSYYEAIASDPNHGALWGYGRKVGAATLGISLSLLSAMGITGFSVLNHEHLKRVWNNHLKGEKMTPADMQQLGLSLLKTGFLTGAAMIAFTSGVSREIAHPVTAWLMILSALKVMAGEYREPIQQVPGAKTMPLLPKDLSLKKPLEIPKKLAGAAVPAAALWLGGEAVYRFLADSASRYQFTPGGHHTIYGNWLNWEGIFNMPLFASEVFTELCLMVFLWARLGGIVQNSSEVAYHTVSSLIHTNKTNSGKTRQWLQAAVPQLPEVTLENKDGTPGEKILDREGNPVPRYLGVRLNVQRFTEEEKNKIAQGIMPEGPLARIFGHTTVTGALSYISYQGISSLMALSQGISPHTVADSLLVTAGGAALFFGASTMLPNGSMKKYYSRIASLMAHMFGQRGRGAYWAVYTPIGTAVTLTIGTCSQILKGFTLTPTYFFNLAKRSLLNPWVNRLMLAWRSAYWPDKPLSKFGFFAVGFFTVYCGIEYGSDEGQTTQAFSLRFQALAREYAVSSDPVEQARLLGEMQAMESLLRDAVNTSGHGKAEVLQRATAELERVEQIKTAYVERARDRS